MNPDSQQVMNKRPEEVKVLDSSLAIAALPIETLIHPKNAASFDFEPKVVVRQAE